MKTWSQEQRENTTCEKCGAEYTVVMKRYPMRDEDKFDCVVCGHRIDEWNSTCSPVYTLVSRPTTRPSE